MHTRALQHTDGRPVRHARRAFHQKEVFVLDRTHHVVRHRGRDRNLYVVGRMPLRVIVPGNNIELRAELEVIEAVVEAHQVRRHRDIRVYFLHGVALHFHEIDGLVRDKALPIERQAVHVHFAVRLRRVNLVPARIRVAPEVRPPRVVQVIERLILLFQPIAERLLAQRAVALAAVLVRKVPQNDARVVCKALCKALIHLAGLLSVHGGCIAVVMARAGKVAHTVILHTANLLILFAHPKRLCTGRCGQHGINAVFVEIVDDLLQPVEVVFALIRLQMCPGENTDRHAVDIRFLHQLHVLLENLGIAQPLFGIIIAAMQQLRKFRCKGSHNKIPPSARLPARNLHPVYRLYGQTSRVSFTFFIL